MQDDNQKIYLYNRRLFTTDSSQIPKEVRLKPFEIPIPLSSDVPISIALEGSSSPALRTLVDQEKKYLNQLRRGEVYLSCSEQVSYSCKRCIEQMEIQFQALQAAIGNLDDHYKSTQSAYESAREKLQEQQIHHKTLLDNFESSLERLKKIPVHPSLYPTVTTEEEAMQQKERGLTLLDTIPVEKEHAWVSKCTKAHQKVEENMSQLQLVYEKVTTSLQNLDSKNISINISNCRTIVNRIDEDIFKLKTSLADIRESYHLASDKLAIILDKVASNSLIEADAVALSQYFGGETAKQEIEIVNPMEDICLQLMKAKDHIGLTKNNITREIFRVMKQVAHIQTDIQFKLRKGMDLMKKWRQGDNGYFQHLERIQHLPESYREFLREVLRRKQYTENFEKLIRESVARIQAFRDEETKRRESFMLTLGNSLPPLFFDSVPSLIEKPPYFNATMTERQFLPDITVDDITTLASLGVYQMDEEIPPSMNSSLSSVTLYDGESIGGLITRDRTESTNSIGEKDVNFPALDNQSQVSAQNRLQELELENRALQERLDQLSRVEAQLSEDKTIETVDPVPQEEAPLFQILRRLEEDVHFIVDKTIKQNRGGRKDESINPELTEGEIAFQELTEAIIRAQTAFDSQVKRNYPPASSQKESMVQVPPTDLPKISFLSFNVGDIALFLVTNKPDVYLAFSHGKCPNRYLSQDSLKDFKSSKQSTPPGYILGRIIYIETRIASKDDQITFIGPEHNQLRLADGVEYHILEIEHVSFGSKAARRKSGTGSMKTKDQIEADTETKSERLKEMNDIDLI